jgi:hypothetical protein
MITIKSPKALAKSIARYNLGVVSVERRGANEVFYLANHRSGNSSRFSTFRNSRRAEIPYTDAVELHARGVLRKHRLFA